MRSRCSGRIRQNVNGTRIISPNTVPRVCDRSRTEIIGRKSLISNVPIGFILESVPLDYIYIYKITKVLLVLPSVFTVQRAKSH